MDNCFAALSNYCPEKCEREGGGGGGVVCSLACVRQGGVEK